MSKMIFPSATLGAGVSNAADYEQYGYDVRGLQTFARFSSITGTGVTNQYDGFGWLRSSSTNMDGTGTGNDLGIGFSYNPASQVVARSQTNGTYDYPIPAVNQAYTSNGRNQYTQVGGAALRPPCLGRSLRKIDEVRQSRIIAQCSVSSRHGYSRS
jgi:hypothetical protein